MRIIKRSICIIAAFIIIILTTACSDTGISEEPETSSFFAMDTYMTLTAYGDNGEEALKKAEEKVHNLDELLSVSNKEGEIYALNASGEGKLGKDAAYILGRSIEICSMTDGCFNPMIYPLMEIWGFTDQNYKVPGESDILSLLPLVSMDSVSFDSETGYVSFADDGMKIDFGAIAKGYTSSVLMDIFKECGIKSACVSLGGNVQVLGSKPDGSAWKVGIRDPYDPSGYLGILSVAGKAVITSGAYERYFEENGIRYHHILDPFTGYPADNGIDSVTVISDDGTLADGLSTAIYVMGLDKAVNLWASGEADFDMIIMTGDHELYITSGIYKEFSPSGYHTNLITK